MSLSIALSLYIYLLLVLSSSFPALFRFIQFCILFICRRICLWMGMRRAKQKTMAGEVYYGWLSCCIYISGYLCNA